MFQYFTFCGDKIYLIKFDGQTMAYAAKIAAQSCLSKQCDGCILLKQNIWDRTTLQYWQLLKMCEYDSKFSPFYVPLPISNKDNSRQFWFVL